jgi:Protein of unknown function (DUF3768)
VYRPHRELQKAAPRNFDAFFEPVSLEKQKKTFEIPAVRAPRFYFAFDARLCAIHGFGRAISPLHVAIKRLKQKGDQAMTTSNAKRIAELNDRFRSATANDDPAGLSLGKKLFTCGIRDLGLLATVEIAERVAAFDSFTPDNDPHREHDFGSIDYNGQRVFWKIDYYAGASLGTGRDMGSEDPGDPAQTLRVLTIMLASEY